MKKNALQVSKFPLILNAKPLCQGNRASGMLATWRPWLVILGVCFIEVQYNSSYTY